MNLSPKAEQSLDFAKSCWLQGLCTTKELLKATKEIYQDDLAKQMALLMAEGFTEIGAVKNIYNLDKGVEVL